MRLGNHLEEDALSIAIEFPNLFRQLHQKKIFITGGSGFFGRWVMAVLKAAIEFYTLETEVFLLTRQEINLLRKPVWLNKISGDIKNFDFKKLPSSMDFILHMAASSNPKDYQNKPESMFEDIVLGAQRILEYGGFSQAKKILVTSSGAVYGKKSRVDQPIREDLIPDLWGADIYSRAKYEAEKIFIFSNIPFVIARCFAFYGETQPIGHGFAIADMQDQIKKFGKIEIKNPGTIRSFMYMGDMVRALFLLLFKPEIEGVFNVGGEKPELILETAHKIAPLCPGEYKIRPYTGLSLPQGGRRYQQEHNEDCLQKLEDPAKEISAVTAGQFNTHNYYVPSVQKLKALGFAERF